MKPLSKILTGSMEKFKAIEGLYLVKAMIAASKRNDKGAFRYTYKEIMKLADIY
jgi:hypothetical protein